MRWINDIFGDQYNEYRRRRSQEEFKFDTCYFSAYYDGRDPNGFHRVYPLFIRANINPDLKTEQKMIVYRLMVNLSQMADAEYAEIPLF